MDLVTLRHYRLKYGDTPRGLPNNSFKMCLDKAAAKQNLMRWDSAAKENFENRKSENRKQEKAEKKQLSVRQAAELEALKQKHAAETAEVTERFKDKETFLKSCKERALKKHKNLYKATLPSLVGGGLSLAMRGWFTENLRDVVFIDGVADGEYARVNGVILDNLEKYNTPKEIFDTLHFFGVDCAPMRAQFKEKFEKPKKRKRSVPEVVPDVVFQREETLDERLAKSLRKAEEDGSLIVL